MDGNETSDAARGCASAVFAVDGRHDEPHDHRTVSRIAGGRQDRQPNAHGSNYQSTWNNVNTGHVPWALQDRQAMSRWPTAVVLSLA